ncbi:hypothetical protein L9F63_002571 [Diploptera punctata]|uniref:Transient receptor ion channel domain-containing protein n=1 Tax=Diploptera punctata TaxID=6984 RepID=A0AAD8ED31_DIPPU|nr:hypothetical protein L9F63_002571 [Diploptera punctata]
MDEENGRPTLLNYNPLPSEFDESTTDDAASDTQLLNATENVANIVDVTSSAFRIQRKSSLNLPKLMDTEKKFFQLVSAGDVNAVKEFLRDTPGLNTNSVDFKGVTALQIAVKRHNEEMVDFLLAQPEIEFGDCALYAVRDDQINILRKILDAMANVRPDLEFEGCPDSTEFPSYITPLIQAAICGHYEIIGMLLERGHEIIHPHHPRCFCAQCKEESRHDDGLRTANQHLSVYQAISNPAYICQSSMDPILTAFKLNVGLIDCSKTILQLRGAYRKLAQEVKAFAVELIGCCRDSAEVEDVLNQWDGCDFAGQVKFPRLMLAMDYNQKEFVAHPNTQEVLDADWSGDWHEWRKKSELLKLLIIFPRMIMLPYITVFCIFLPLSDTVKFHRLPINKMLNSVASYVIFLLLLFMESNQDKVNQKKGPPNTGLEIPLVLYIVGYIWNTTILALRLGPRRFIRVLVNWYDMVMECLFCIAILFWISAYMDVKKSGNADLERKLWNHLEPTLIAEGFFAVATIFAFGRVLLLLQLNLNLGPLQVSLGKMMSQDILKFFILLMVIILAFSAGLCKFYNYYEGMILEDKSTGVKTQQVDSFVNFRLTLKTLFWAIFCMSPIESADVVIENLPDNGEGKPVTNYHDFTEAVGHICFACNFLHPGGFLIVNMMIAELCNTMQKVIDNVDVEWVFGRSAVCMLYANQTVLPPPFNLIPTASGFANVFGWFKTYFRPEVGKSSTFSIAHCCYVEIDIDEERKSNPALMATLCKRYLKQKEQETSMDTEIQALRNEIKELRSCIKKDELQF